AALGGDPERFEAPLIQFVHLVEGGARAQMSKRKGEFVTLDELIDDIGTDAARFFMLQRSHDRTVDLDLELARSESQDNPVFSRDGQVVGSAGGLEPARLGVCVAAQRVIARTLGLLGVSAPERM